METSVRVYSVFFFVFVPQQCIRIDPNFAEAYSNLGNALKELGDVAGAVQFYLKVDAPLVNELDNFNI